MNLFIATPVSEGMCHCGFTLAALRTQAVLLERKISHSFHFDPGNAPISRARNLQVAQFMADPLWTHLMFIDGDMGWSPADLLALIEADKEVACAGYVKRGDPPEFTFTLHDADALEQCPDTGFIEIRDAPTGFILIRRSAFEKMFAAYPELKCKVSKLLTEEEQAYSYALYNTEISEGKLTGEDFVWSRRWHAIGGEIWMHPEIALKHFEGTKVYQGKPSDIFVRAEAAPEPLPASQKEALIARSLQIEGWMEPGELAWLIDHAAQMDSVAEIGCWQGRTTAALLAACRGMVFAIDHFEGGKDEPLDIRERSRGNFEKFLSNVGGAENLSLRKKSSLEAARHCPPVDMVFIDGGHGYDEVRADIRAWLPKAKRLICGHDFYDQNVRQAVADELGAVQSGAGSIWFQFINSNQEQSNDRSVHAAVSAV